MKLTFFSNFLNHHQTPLCDEFFKILKNDFVFVSTEKIPDTFIKSGYPDCTDYKYNLNAYMSNDNYQKALTLGWESDIVIIGAAPEIFIKDRIRQNKITFRYSERILKKGLWQLCNPIILLSLIKNHSFYRRKNIFMLCASAYTSNDFKYIFAYPGKMYKWGYFPKVNSLDINRTIEEKSDNPVKIMWVGRLIKWKHPEMALILASELRKKNYKFHLNIIGSGSMLGYLEESIAKLKIADYVTLLGNMSNNHVLDMMRKSDIFLFTSDKREGWGAVLNEAMSNGCAVVASNEIGSVPFLLKHGYNGLVFRSRNSLDLFKKVEILINNKELRQEISRNAYLTLQKEWSPKNVAERFLLLANTILRNDSICIKDGPCSLAYKTTRNFWQEYNKKMPLI